MPTEPTLDIPADLEPQQAKQSCAIYARRLAEKRPLRIEFDSKNPNVFALQIALSCKRSLEAENCFLGFGPNAQSALSGVNRTDILTKAHL